jgi:hypothetical protein
MKKCEVCKGKHVENPQTFIQTGCKVCGTVYRRVQVVYAEAATHEGVATGTRIVRGCPNERAHERLLRAKAALLRMREEESVERKNGLDMLSLNELTCRIQNARAKLHKRWKKEKGCVRQAYTGEFKENFGSQDLLYGGKDTE